jgi:hypothetical protein
VVLTYSLDRIHFSVACAVIFISTFIPKGAFAFNPKALGSIGQAREALFNETSDADSEGEKDMKQAKPREASA